tara:strand:+ start:831 stop:1016 length:186 start_codon:yes stop_codon:yes gene_type:complete
MILNEQTPEQIKGHLTLIKKLEHSCRSKAMVPLLPFTVKHSPFQTPRLMATLYGIKHIGTN